MNNTQSYIYQIFSRETVAIRKTSVCDDIQSENIFTDIKYIKKEIPFGNGFFVSDYFITAAHVIAESTAPYINVNNQKIPLEQTNAIVWRIMPTELTEEEYASIDIADLAIFHFPDIGSPLHLSEKLPEPSTTLFCNYHYHYIFCESQCVVGDKDYFLGNFFGCRMTPIHPTEGGSSGSPLLKDNIVYGILHAGNKKDTSICVFYSAAHALHLLRQHTG